MNRRLTIFEEIQEQNTKVLNFEISKYFLAKRKKDRQARVTQERREKLNEIEAEIRSEIAANIPVGKPIRSQLQLIRDKLLTTKQLIPDEGQDKRTKGLVEVLMSINEADYAVLKELFRSGQIVIEVPNKHLAGSLSRVAKYTHAILYLSPELESRPYSYVLNVCAHELSHLLLHNSFSRAKRESIQEREAEIQAASWGF